MPTDTEELTKVAAIVAGAGTSGAVAGLLKGFLPTIAPDIAGAIVGGALFYFGDRVHPLLKAFGVGVLAGSLKGTIEKAIPAIGAPPAAQGGGAVQGTTTDTLAALAQAHASMPAQAM